MSEPRIVSPREAQAWMNADELKLPTAYWPVRLAHTVATEPDRIQAAAMKALRDAAQEMREVGFVVAAVLLDEKADAGGSDL